MLKIFGKKLNSQALNVFILLKDKINFGVLSIDFVNINLIFNSKYSEFQ